MPTALWPLTRHNSGKYHQYIQSNRHPTRSCRSHSPLTPSHLVLGHSPSYLHARTHTG
jgi:hypothetical protein